ncbi:MAG: RsmE family RNA methyltransferase [Oligoflexia bacterium]|nr:RsmE family RNA methyltransferase [Oligoflexia bacterium]MBF0364793.1 RsmE family RNA methyltransferase [Oligoflexia bacterium]
MHGILVPKLVYEGKKSLHLEGECIFHLTRVLRVRENESVVVLNGEGKKILTKVLSSTKKSLDLEIISIEASERNFVIDLALGIPKKDTLSEIIKKCVELGVRRLIPLQTLYSQPLVLAEARLHSLIESAMIQSNNPFYLEIAEKLTLSQTILALNEYTGVVYFTEKLQEDRIKKNLQLWKEAKGEKTPKILIVIGPEGGLSVEEENQLLAIPNLISVHLPAYLMKCPTAVCTACGYIFAQL